MNESVLNSVKVSVVITTFNRASLLKKAIDSVLNQTYRNYEIVIVDDNSNDETSTLVAYYLEKYENVVYIKNKVNCGVAASRNIGVEKSSGLFVTGLDDDDQFTVDRLEYFVDNFDQKWAFLCTGFFYKNNGQNVPCRNYQEVFDLQDMLYSNKATHAFFLRERFLEIGGQDSNLLANEDYDFWLRMNENYGAAIRLPKATYIISNDHGLERKGTSTNVIKGHYQFIEKHAKKMSKAQYNSQLMQVMIRELKPMSLRELVKLISPHIFWKAVKYYLISNFKLLKEIEQKLLMLKASKYQ